MRFFKSLSPRIAIMCGDGSQIRWEMPESGVAAGYHATEEPVELVAIFNCMRRRIGGNITEITEEEYEAVKKKGRYGERRPQREAISAPDAPDTAFRSPPSPPPPPARREVVVETAPVSDKEEDVEPKVGRRV